MDLRARARREGRPTDELLVLYVLKAVPLPAVDLEYRSRLVLKGGMLLAAFDERRPTADVDLLARAIANDVEVISGVVREVLAVAVDDGVTFEPDRLRAQVIRDADPYTRREDHGAGSRRSGSAPLRIDINVGDPVTPGPVEVTSPALLAEPFELVGYPLETVLAEKIVTMIDRGDATTRDRDFADVFVLTGRHEVDAEQLAVAVRSTGAHLTRIFGRSGPCSRTWRRRGRPTGPGCWRAAGSTTRRLRPSQRPFEPSPTSPIPSSPAG